ncbi:toprim domain-containing protein [Paraburkholderia kururiensis]|uniref:Toprim domain-containing protein n=1 Tax=Paraburkholderia kururiensis TaxID=984307 RepID=A0ABZ0WSN0_9BURK|nr:toprim domain-containing protein [Paraburkholderia kururiensis]WQD80268.1 toprim domain-containing protein [Paraburkholderia kururiensis]
MSDFVRFAASHGVLISHLDDSGRIRRCPTDSHPRSRNGAYMFDGRRGWVMAWDGAAETVWFDDPHARSWTDAEKRVWAEKRRASERLAARRRADAVHRAEKLISTAVIGEHNYFHFKGLPEARGLVLPDRRLIVPMRSMQGELRGVQSIYWDYDDLRWVKKMIFGMSASGAVFRIGPSRASETILCEGYATGLSIEMAARQMRLNAAVLICFNDSNMAAMAPFVAGRKYVFADNDQSNAGQRAAEKTGLPWTMSDAVGEDANDLHKRAGLMAVCRKLMEARRTS